MRTRTSPETVTVCLETVGGLGADSAFRKTVEKWLSQIGLLPNARVQIQDYGKIVSLTIPAESLDDLQRNLLSLPDLYRAIFAPTDDTPDEFQVMGYTIPGSAYGKEVRRRANHPALHVRIGTLLSEFRGI